MTGKVAAAPREVFSMLANADMKFPTIKDDKGNDAMSKFPPPRLVRDVLCIFVQAVFGSLRRRARARSGIRQVQCGSGNSI